MAMGSLVKLLVPQFFHLCNRIGVIAALGPSLGCYKVVFHQWTEKALCEEPHQY